MIQVIWSLHLHLNVICIPEKEAKECSLSKDRFPDLPTLPRLVRGLHCTQHLPIVGSLPVSPFPSLLKTSGSSSIKTYTNKWN